MVSKKISKMGNNVSLQVCDPTGTVCVGDGLLSFTGFGLSVGFDISGCSDSVSVGQMQQHLQLFVRV